MEKQVEEVKNPVKELMEEKDWTYSDLIVIADVCESTIYKNLQGSMVEVSEKILKVVDELGMDREAFKDQYQSFRREKRKELLKNRR
jgi:predicted transcriptional regulator